MQLISGQYVCPNNLQASPHVEIQLLSIPSECVKHKSKIIQRNAVNPVWNEQFTFQVGIQTMLRQTRWSNNLCTSGQLTLLPYTMTENEYQLQLSSNSLVAGWLFSVGDYGMQIADFRMSRVWECCPSTIQNCTLFMSYAPIIAHYFI